MLITNLFNQVLTENFTGAVFRRLIFTVAIFISTRHTHQTLPTKNTDAQIIKIPKFEIRVPKSFRNIFFV